MEETRVNKDYRDSMERFRIPRKGTAFIEGCAENIVVFAKYMLGVNLYSWQVDFLTKIQEAMEVKDNELVKKEFLAITSRQIGKSTAVAILGLWSCIFNKYPATINDNTSYGITSASDVQAKKLLYEMKKIMRLGDKYIALNYKDEEDKPLFGTKLLSSLLDSEEPNNTTTITFKPHNPKIHGDYLLKDSKSGSVIKSYPPTSSVLGETFSVVIIDEAGKTDKISDQFYYDFISPTGDSTNAIYIYLSTPWTSSGFFYRLVDPDDMFPPDENVDKLLFTIDAIEEENNAQYKKVKARIDRLNSDGKTDEVQRAYYCRFVKGEQNYFDPQKVIDAFTKDYQMVETYTGMCDLGVDFGGQVKSQTVLTISAMDDDGGIKRLYHRSYGVGEDNTLMDDISELKTRFNIQRIIPDDCPQGDYMIRDMKERGWNVEPMNFRSEKVKKYGAFRATLNRGEIESYSDSDLQTEMLAMEYSHGSRQSVIQHAPNYSDDLIDSFVLSCYFFVTEDTGLKTYDYDTEEDSSIYDTEIF